MPFAALDDAGHSRNGKRFVEVGAFIFAEDVRQGNSQERRKAKANGTRTRRRPLFRVAAFPYRPKRDYPIHFTPLKDTSRTRPTARPAMTGTLIFGVGGACPRPPPPPPPPPPVNMPPPRGGVPPP